MVIIDRLRLHLPTQYRDRAALIARQVATELGALTWERPVRLESLHVPPITIPPGCSDGHLARKIALAVQEQMNALPR